MDIYASDEEKGEEIKQWWRDHGFTVLVGFMVMLGAMVGGRYWFSYQQAHAESASIAYQNVVSLLSEDKFADADDQLQLLLKKYPKTPYAVFSVFEMAKETASNGDIASTKNYLEWAIDNAQLSGHIAVARLRLASILLDESLYQEAIDMLTRNESAAFTSLYSELRGDIFIAQGNTMQARAEYQSALLTAQQGDSRRQLLELKLDDIAGSQDG